MSARPTRAEARALEADRKAQERGAGTHVPPRRARGYVHATHPEHGEAVVFLPGEALPAWVKEEK